MGSTAPTGTSIQDTRLEEMRRAVCSETGNKKMISLKVRGAHGYLSITHHRRAGGWTDQLGCGRRDVSDFSRAGVYGGALHHCQRFEHNGAHPGGPCERVGLSRRLPAIGELSISAFADCECCGRHSGSIAFALHAPEDL